MTRRRVSMPLRFATASHPLSRRELLQVGYSSMLSLGLAGLVEARARGALATCHIARSAAGA